MPQLPENLTMDTGIAFIKKNKITISTHTAILYVVASIASVVATGLIVHYLSVCPDNALGTDDNATTNNATLPEILTTVSIEQINATTFTALTTETPTTPTTTPETGNTTQQPSAEDSLSVRLPRAITPSAYNLTITPFFNNFSFAGSVKITLRVHEATSNITLHANELNIDLTSVLLTDNNTNTIRIKNTTSYVRQQFFVLNFDQELPEGSYYLSMRYNASLNDAMAGFYRSSYQKGNETRWLAATQFQPTDARRAFPCFDEPAMKAMFTLRIGRPRNMTAISNMPKLHTENSSEIAGYEIDHFNTSVPMSTYLLAFIVFDFQSRSVGNISVWAREEAINQTAYSLEVTSGVLKYYEEFFKIPYPLPKTDLVALPDFAAGAMENWGLITFREVALLYEDGISSKKSMETIVSVIAHELAHQWFGNLVTPSWWTDLWLNEGFATYLENVGANAVQPEWHMFEQFVVSSIQVVLRLDALKSSHQISIVVNDPVEINDIFNRISYEKGSAIIYMMNNFLTTPVFQQGLTNYLNDKEYSNADQDDLWRFLTEEAHKNDVLQTNLTVKEIMDTWTLQVGYPVVHVARDYNTSLVTLTQERFLLEHPHSDNKSLWWIPLTYTTSNGNSSSLWFRNQHKMRTNIIANASQWILFNLNETAYARINYDVENWRLLTLQLLNNHTAIGEINRAQIIDDALSLASADYVDYNLALDITTYLVNESQYAPWKAAINNLNYLHSMFIRSGYFDRFKHYFLHLVDPLYKLVGVQDQPTESLLTTFIREDVLTKACDLGQADCISNALRQFQNWRASPSPEIHNPISPNLKWTIYCTAIRHGGEEEWNFAWEQYLKANVASERNIILHALGCSREVWLLNKYLAMSINEDSGIRKQDIISVFRALGDNIIAQPLAFRFLSSNWEKFKSYLGSNVITLNFILQACTNNLNTVEDAHELREFAEAKSTDLQHSRTMSQVIEQTDANIVWMDKNFHKIVKWLENYNAKHSRSAK